MPLPAPPSKRRRFDPLVITVEVGSIVLAVLLAFAVNEWRDSQAAEARVEAVQRAVRQELEQNRRVLAARLPYHEAMRDSVWAQQRRFDREALTLRPGERLPMIQQLGFGGGLGTASELTHSGWETALATDVLTYMDIDDVSLISTVYAKQTMVNTTAERLLETLNAYNRGAIAGIESAFAASNFGATLTDVVLRQQEQIALYDSLLAVLPEHSDPDR